MKKKLLNNWQLKLVTLVFAFIFWQIVGKIADPITTEIYYNVPVTILNEEIITDQGKAYQIENAETTVNVIVKAETSVLHSIKASDIIATADFEEIILSELVPVQVEIAGFEGQYIEAVTNPINLIVVIEDSISKKFPIVPSTSGVVEEGYDLGTMTTEPETVTISGPESLVNSIVRVEAQVNITGITEDTSLVSQLTFYDANNVEIDQSLLSTSLGIDEDVYVNVQILDTKTIDLEFEVSGIPKSGYQVVSVTAEPTSIVISATQEVLDTISSLSVPSSALDITGESGKVDRVIDISEYLPEEVQLYDENNNTIAVTVQIDKLGTKSFEMPVQSIVVKNNPSNLTLSYDGITDIMVTFSGLEADIDSLVIDDIEVSIDLSKYNKAGEYDVPVTVVTSEGYELVDEITVSIVLSEN